MLPRVVWRNWSFVVDVVIKKVISINRYQVVVVVDMSLRCCWTVKKYFAFSFESFKDSSIQVSSVQINSFSLEYCLKSVFKN